MGLLLPGFVGVLPRTVCRLEHFGLILRRGHQILVGSSSLVGLGLVEGELPAVVLLVAVPPLPSLEGEEM